MKLTQLSIINKSLKLRKKKKKKSQKPLRQLSTDWRINVKMTDSVTEGKYALCRKALTSLDTWARDAKDRSSSSATEAGRL